MWKSLIVTHQLAKFNGHGLCDSSNITGQICHITLKDHVIKDSCGFMERNCLLYVTTIPGLMATSIVVVEI